MIPSQGAMDLRRAPEHHLVCKESGGYTWWGKDAAIPFDSITYIWRGDVLEYWRAMDEGERIRCSSWSLIVFREASTVHLGVLL